MRSFISIALLFIMSISGNDINIELSGNKSNVKISILKVIPIGSDINRATIIMEKNGFKCGIQKDSSFAEGEKVYENIDFLYCDRGRGFLTGRRWQVAIVFKNSLVEEIYVSIGLTGP